MQLLDRRLGKRIAAAAEVLMVMVFAVRLSWDPLRLQGWTVAVVMTAVVMAEAEALPAEKVAGLAGSERAGEMEVW